MEKLNQFQRKNDQSDVDCKMWAKHTFWKKLCFTHRILFF